MHDHREAVNSHGSVPGHRCHSPAESELPLHGPSVLLLEGECCPSAHEVREIQWMSVGLTYVLIVYVIVKCRPRGVYGIHGLKLCDLKSVDTIIDP